MSVYDRGDLLYKINGCDLTVLVLHLGSFLNTLFQPELMDELVERLQCVEVYPYVRSGRLVPP